MGLLRFRNREYNGAGVYQRVQMFTTDLASQNIEGKIRNRSLGPPCLLLSLGQQEAGQRRNCKNLTNFQFSSCKTSNVSTL